MGLESTSGEFVDIGYVSGMVSVTTSQIEAKAGSSRLTNRQFAMIYNDGTAAVYFGPTGVTSTGSTKGIPIQPKQALSLEIGDQGLFLIAAAGTISCLVQEWS